LIDWETGSLIAEAIGVAPWEVLDDDFEDAA
jgi:lambda repressor-like predicted transcriptional regulator